ncbi:MAG: hypothetical protein H6702_05485 [Myxococcales bacterium]|nr:hypothetical protein [Myxococcales bacterium]
MAPQIQVPATGSGLLDVAGGGADNGGMVVVLGAVDGPLEVQGETLRCP